MGAVLSTQALTKHFGSVHAVNGVDLEVEAGQIYGMLGPNGSGKTTTLGMLLGTIRPTSGTFSWMGQYGAHHQIRNRIGAILEGPIFYPYMTGRQNLEVSCLIKDVPSKRIPEVMEWVGLGKRQHHKFRTYSLGMKQRLAIAAALLTDPDVLILDEPTNGLDPQGIADIRGLIRDIAKMGKTIVLASHLLDEVQKVCSHFCVLRHGNLIYQGGVEDALGGRNIIQINATDVSALKSAAAAMNLHVAEMDEHLEIESPEQLDPGALNQHFFNRGVVLTHLQPITRSLEQQFLQILKEHDSSTASH